MTRVFCYVFDNSIITFAEYSIYKDTVSVL